MCDNMDLSIEQWLMNNGVNGLWAFLLWKMIEAQKTLAEEVGKLRGLLGVYINGRNRTNKKDSAS